MSMGGYFKHTKFRTDNLPCIGMSAVSMCRCAASPPDTTRQFTSGYRMKWWWARWALGATQLGGSAVILRETPPTESLMVAWGHLASPRGPYTPPGPVAPHHLPPEVPVQRNIMVNPKGRGIFNQREETNVATDEEKR